MKKLLAVALVLIVLSPAVAFAGSSTDAALALGAFAVFNQILSGTGIFGGLLGRQAVVVAPPASRHDLSAGTRFSRHRYQPARLSRQHPLSTLRHPRSWSCDPLRSSLRTAGTTRRRLSTGTRRVQSRSRAAGARLAT